MGNPFSRDANPDGRESTTIPNSNGTMRDSNVSRMGLGDGSGIFPPKMLHYRQPSIRSKQPLPEASEIEKQFAKLLVSNHSFQSKNVTCDPNCPLWPYFACFELSKNQFEKLIAIQR